VPAAADRRWPDTFLAGYFVAVRDSGSLAATIGLQYSAPFTCRGVALVAWRR
jgi:hypothetical protein